MAFSIKKMLKRLLQSLNITKNMTLIGNFEEILSFRFACFFIWPEDLHCADTFCVATCVTTIKEAKIMTKDVVFNRTGNVGIPEATSFPEKCCVRKKFLLAGLSPVC